MASNVVTREYLELLGLPVAGVQYVLDVCSSPPDRKVGRRRRRNLILEVPMRNLSAVLQAESLSGEFPFLLELDRRGDVTAAFDQPIAVRLEITDRAGRRTRTSYTADYLVVYTDRVCAIEVKADRELETLIRVRPDDWRYDRDAFRYVPAKEYFGALGIDHVVIPNSSFNPIRADNLGILNTVRGLGDTKRYRKTREGLMHLLGDEETMLMADILERIGDTDTTPILQLINEERLFVDLDRVTLSDPASVWVSISATLAVSATEAGSTLLSLMNSSPLSSADVVDPRYELEVASRLCVAQGMSNKDRHGNEVSARTARRYRDALRCSGGNPVSLQPKWENCGNHDLRTGVVHLTYVRGCIHTGKGDPNHPTAVKCFQDYKHGFQRARSDLGFFDERPISRASFYRYWNKAMHSDQDSYSQGGRRLQNVESDSLDPRDKSSFASRPFAIAHIDHWKTDLFLVVGSINGKAIVQRPWLTAMVDAFSGEVLAIWLSFANPSRKSCTMVIRDCVRRHGRLPEMIIVDGGSDFKSCHFQVMLATLGVIRCERPPEDPRFGQEVERLFGAFKDRFVRGMPGYGISIERSRAVSASFKSDRRATLSLIDAFNVLEAYTFQGYNHNLRPGENWSRYALRERLLASFPHCGRSVIWDNRFLVATSIEAPDRTYKLWPGRGLHVNDRWYTAPGLMRYRGYKKDIAVRLEPYADSVVYVCIESKWFVCMNSNTRQHSSLSERSLLMASAERSDLSALRKELANEMTMYAASVVNDRLREIAGRQDAKPVVTKSSDQDQRGDRTQITSTSLNFDDIEPYANEPL